MSEQHHHDCSASPGTTISYAEALEKLNEEATAAGLLSAEPVPLESSATRVLAEDVLGRERLPAHDNSAVDGFALRSDEVALAQLSGPARFTVRGRVVAGDLSPKTDSLPYQAWEIMTGAPFPAGFDCSVKIEDTEVTRDAAGAPQSIVVSASVAGGENVRPAGEDYEPGTRVLTAGEAVGPQHVLAAAAHGITRLTVRRRPRIALLSTGGELAPHDRSPQSGQTRNSTLPFLRALLAARGWELVTQATAGDSPDELWDAFKGIHRHEPDVIITTGGVSMGVHDHVATVAGDLGARTVFHRVSIRPGKPIFFARFPGTGPAVFGLPGNPLSTVVGMRFFVEPYLRARLGMSPETPFRARLTADVAKPKGLRCFYKARWSQADGSSVVTALKGQASFMIRPLVEANAWAVLAEGGTAGRAEDWVDVYPLGLGAP